MSIKFVILHHAGGAAHTYRDLAQALPLWLDVYCHDLPGHGQRADEPLQNDMEALVQDLQNRIGPLENRPWALFGHSMGAVVAHAFIGLRRRMGLSLPYTLFASAAPSPTSAAGKTEVAHLPEAAFWERVGAFGGLPEEALRDSAFRNYFETLLRHDFAATENYTPAPEPFDVPIRVLHGISDPVFRNVADSWLADTTAGMREHPFAGGHFYLFEHLARIGRLVGAVLQPARGRR